VRSELRVLGWLLAACVLTGCERTVFRHAPAEAAAECDPALVGRWLSQDDNPQEEGELVATVDAQCRLVTVERKAEGPRTSAPTTLRSGRADGVRYLWVDAAWANASFDVDATPLDQPGDVYVFAWRTSRGQLELAAPPHRSLAHKVLDKDMEGEVMLHDDSLTVRLTGERDELRKLLRTWRVYRFDKSLRFRRDDGADAKR
jgi:hypothetical protein